MPRSRRGAPQQAVLMLQPARAVRRGLTSAERVYRPENQFYAPADPCSAAEAFAGRVTNLWVDHSVDEEWVALCAESRLRH